MNNDEIYMKLAMEQAQIAANKGEVPVGAVIIRSDSGEVVADTAATTFHEHEVTVEDIQPEEKQDVDREAILRAKEARERANEALRQTMEEHQSKSNPEITLSATEAVLADAEQLTADDNA